MFDLHDSSITVQVWTSCGNICKLSLQAIVTVSLSIEKKNENNHHLLVSQLKVESERDFSLSSLYVRKTNCVIWGILFKELEILRTNLNILIIMISGNDKKNRFPMTLFWHISLKKFFESSIPFSISQAPLGAMFSQVLSNGRDSIYKGSGAYF